MTSDELIAASVPGPGGDATGGRPGCLVGFGAVALGALIVVAVMTLLMQRMDGAVDIGNVAQYAPGTVTYRSSDGVLVVRKPDGGVVAFSDIDPHNPPGRAVCLVTFRPDLGPPVMDGTRGGGAPAGRFFDRCTGAMYDLDGHGLAGDGLDLQPVPVVEEDKGRLLAFPRR